MRFRTLTSGIKERHETNKKKILKKAKKLNLNESLKEDLILFEEEDGTTKEIPIKRAIARLAYLYSVRMVNASNERIPKYNTALLLLNQAQLVSEEDRGLALKLYNQARKLLRK